MQTEGELRPVAINSLYAPWAPAVNEKCLGDGDESISIGPIKIPLQLQILIAIPPRKDTPPHFK